MIGIFHAALRNLIKNPTHTLLSSLGIAVTIAGFLGMGSIASGFSHSIGDYYGKLDGIYVLKKGSPDPVFSILPSNLGPKLEGIEGVANVSPELWSLASDFNGTESFSNGFLSFVTVGGLEAGNGSKPTHSVYAKSVTQGNFLVNGETGKVLLSERIAQACSKKLYDTITIENNVFMIIGMYDTGSFILDSAAILSLDDARTLSDRSPDFVSSYYVTILPGSEETSVIEGIKTALPSSSVRRASTWTSDFRGILANVDAFTLSLGLFSTVLTAVIVAISMTISIRQRMRNFGIMYAEGWTRMDIGVLACIESTLLCVAGGLIGFLAWMVLETALVMILPFKPDTKPSIILMAACIEMIAALIGSILPLIAARKLNPAETMRNL